MIIGIDLGTTNSSSAFLNEDNITEVIINEKGNRLTPSIVYFRKKDEAVVGETATITSSLEEDKIIRNIKRKMGENYRVSIFSRDYSPSEISSIILKKIKKYSEIYLKQEIKDSVITVPAYFNHRQRAATKRAGEIAGFENIKIINEPTAALLAYNIHNTKDENIVVIDIGGGTFDITIMENKKGFQKVLATGGDVNLGGIDFDEKIIDSIIKDFYLNNNIDLRNDLLAMNQLRLTTKKAKEDLSFLDSTSIIIPYITITENGPLHLRYELTRENFKKITTELIEKIINIIDNTFNQNNIDFDWIDKVLFIGGTTRIPFLRESILKFFKSKTNKDETDLLPDIKINPDEAVSIGAAIYGGIIEGRIQDIEFFDAISHYLGIEEDNGNFVPLINKNENYPLTKTKTFTTIHDNQEFIKIKVIQKRELDSEDSNELGYFFLDDLPKMKAGEPDIEVEFNIDKNGILNVSAFELETGSKKEVVIKDFSETKDFSNERRGKNINVL